MSSTYSNYSLRNFSETYINQAKLTYTEAVVSGIKKQILQKAYTDSNKNQCLGIRGENSESKYKLRINIPFNNIQSYNGQDINLIYSLVHNFNPKNLIPSIIEKIKEEFPEMNIQVDPLQTYMLLNWSE